MKRAAFTLIELLVVVVIIAILVSMLVPVAADAWNMWMMTKCQSNLNAQYKAEASWRADTSSAGYTPSIGWQGLLMPYVEQQQEIFICPASPAPGTTFVQPAQCYFMIHTIPGIVSPGATPYEAYPITIPLDHEGPWAEIVEKTDQYEEWHVDDGEHQVVSGRGGDDIQFRIHYEGGVPAWVQTFPGSSSSRFEYRYEFYINGELFTRDWYNEYAKESKRFELPYGKSVTDYGLSRGTYKVLDERVGTVDPKLFFILDYPKPTADYSDPFGGGDTWPKYFIDEDTVFEDGGWMSRFGHELKEEETWKHYQALRHYGSANVLFCDGHIELLGPEELEVTNPLWRYGDL